MADMSNSLQQQVEQAAQSGQPLTIIGGGSKQFMGRACPEYTPLSLAEHTGVVEYQPLELVLSVRAGTRLSDIDAILDEHNQCLSFDPPRFAESATIGGTLACHLSGPGRPFHGSVRDHVLGVRLLNGEGSLLRFGGQVMKNVAGYDVSRLQAGAMGTLGVITDVSLKVLPKPESQLTLTYEVAEGDAIHFMNRHACQAKPLAAACWWQGQVYLRLAGADAAVQACRQEWGGTELANESTFWAQLRDQQLAFFDGDTPLYRFSLGSTAAAIPAEGEWLLDWAGSQRWLRSPATMPELEALAQQAQGQVSLFRGGDRSGEVLHTPQPQLRKLQQDIKRSFDPRGIFNPGRLYSWM